MKKILFVVLVNILFVSCAQAYNQWTWIWDNTNIDRREEIMRNLQANNFNRIYIQFDISRSKDSYKEFISYLKKSGVEVYLLDGNPRWIFESEQKWLTDIVQWFNNYQSSVWKNERFVWIRLDIEPWTLPEWNTNKEDMVCKYQNTISHIRNNLLNKEEYIWLDIPFWFDEISYNNVYWKWILYDWLTGYANELTLMAYRNIFDGSNGIKGLTLYEIEHHRKNNKYQLNIGIETLKSAEWSNMSFATVWYNAMIKELNMAIPYIRENNTWLDIHDYRSFLELKWAITTSFGGQEKEQKIQKIPYIEQDNKEWDQKIQKKVSIVEIDNSPTFIQKCKFFLKSLTQIFLQLFL